MRAGCNPVLRVFWWNSRSVLGRSLTGLHWRIHGWDGEGLGGRSIWWRCEVHSKKPGIWMHFRVWRLHWVRDSPCVGKLFPTSWHKSEGMLKGRSIFHPFTEAAGRGRRGCALDFAVKLVFISRITGEITGKTGKTVVWLIRCFVACTTSFREKKSVRQVC